MGAFDDLIPDVAADVRRERDAARAARDAAGVSPKIAAQPPDFLSDLMLGAKKRALGIGQLTGLVDEELGQDLAKQYQQSGEGTGVRGAIGEMLGDPLTYATAAFGAPTNLLKLAGMGAASGAAMGATDPLQAGQDRLTHTGQSAVIGAVAAPVIGKGLQVAGRAVEKAVINPAIDTFKAASQWIKSNPKDVLAVEIRGMGSTDDILKAVAGLSDDAKAQFRQASNAGLNPKQAYLSAKFAEKGGIMTKGQAAQDPALQRLEEMARQGLLGDEARSIASNTEQLNKGALRNWASQLLSDVTGNPNAVVDETTTGDIIGGALKRRYAELKAPVDAAYKAGGKSMASVNMEHLANFPKNVRQVLDENNIFISDAPMFKKDLNMLEQLTRKLPDSDKYAVKSVKLNAIEKLAQRMNGKAQWDTPLSTVSNYNQRQEILAYRKMMPELRALQDDILVNNVLNNADDAALELRKAPALNTAFRRAFGKKDPVTLIAENDLTDKQIANYLGSGVAGKGEAVNFVRGLKNALGEQSEEVIGQVRGTFLNRIMRGALDKGDDAAFGTAIKGELAKLKQNNKQLYDELFTPDQQAALQDFADVAFQASNAVKSRVNPSGSGIFNQDMILSIVRRMGMGGSFAADAASSIMGETGKALQAKQAIQLMTEPFKRIPADSRFISSAIAPRVTRQASPFAASAGSGYIESGKDSPVMSEPQNYTPSGAFDDLMPTRIDVTPADIPAPQSSLSQQDFMRMATALPFSGMMNSATRSNPQAQAQYESQLADMGFMARGNPTMNTQLPTRQESQQYAASNFNPSNDLFQRIAMAESSGNPNAKAKTSSASGLYQFTDGTFKAILRKYGKDTGFTMKDKNNPQAQEWAMQKLTAENAASLQKTLGRQPTDGELYLAHFAGAGGAKRLLKANPNVPAARILPKAAKANKPIFYGNGKPLTVAQVMNKLAGKVS